ncbi:type II secretion system F family protein [Nocardioides speluncae]|uniref:type II secretion system F family protein n=1 Tax=Nocardioides speluncae TaxID=2670337 RepID=UPI000D6928BB|nr:type II secretion system F family protein [Nocardioides speluncae]
MVSIPIITMILLATLTLVVVGIGVLVQEQDRRRSLAFVVGQDRSSSFNRFRRNLERRILRTGWGRRLRWQLNNADVTWPIADTVIGAFLVACAGAYASYVIGGPVLTIIVMALLLWGARMWFKRREEARFARFIDQLPDLARLLANAASAGLSLRAALSVAAQETIEPTKSELNRVNEELALGSSLDDALSRMGDRLPSRELAVLVNVLVIQSRAGGKIVTALQGITEALEIRRDLRREVATLIAGSKATVAAVSLLGAGMVFLVHSSVEGGLRAVLSNPFGIGIFVFSLALYLLGIVMVRRAIKVEV